MKIKEFFKNKRNVYIVIGIAVAIVLILIIIFSTKVFKKNSQKQFKASPVQYSRTSVSTMNNLPDNIAENIIDIEMCKNEYTVKDGGVSNEEEASPTLWDKKSIVVTKIDNEEYIDDGSDEDVGGDVDHDDFNDNNNGEVGTGDDEIIDTPGGGEATNDYICATIKSIKYNSTGGEVTYSIVNKGETSHSGFFRFNINGKSLYGRYDNLVGSKNSIIRYQNIGIDWNGNVSFDLLDESFSSYYVNAGSDDEGE